MLEKDLALGQLTRQIVRVYLDVDLELLCHRVLQVFIQLAISIEEAELVGSLRRWLQRRGGSLRIALSFFARVELEHIPLPRWPGLERAR